MSAQGSGALTVGQIEGASAKRGATFTEKVPLHLKSGYHVNSNAPADEYLIPLKLTWMPGSIVADEVRFPKPQMEHFPFSEKPVSVFSGTIVVETKFHVLPAAKVGMGKVTGKLRYQACSDKECLPPKTIDVEVPVDIQQ